MRVKIVKSGKAFRRLEDGRMVSPLKDTIVEVDDATGQGLVDDGYAESVSAPDEEPAPPPPVEGQAAAPNATEGAIEEAEERGVDLSQVDGTGKDGRITQPDVVRHAHDASQEEREGSGRQGRSPSETTALAGPEETR